MEKEEKKSNDNNFGVASVILGIISIVFAFGINVHGTILGIIGLIFALVQRKNSKNKWASWGIILNVIGIILNILVLIWIVVTVAKQIQDSGLLDQINQLSQLQGLGNQ